jgi:uncharacterized protein (DUF2267 family)
MGTKNKRTMGAVAVALVAALIIRPGTRANRSVRHGAHSLGRRARFVGGRLQGLRYHLAGRRPDPDVSDDVFADRIRSSIGGVAKRLDVPRVLVTVEDHVARLHGAVGTAHDAAEIERAVLQVSGVEGVESYLHVGLEGGDTRPSTGRAVQQPSDAYRRLVAAVGAHDVAPSAAGQVIRAVLGTFADRLPEGERQHIATHLPADVRELFTPPRRSSRAAPPRTVEALVADVTAATSVLAAAQARPVTEAVLEALRTLVPEEAANVAAVLPADLRQLWHSLPTSRGASPRT